MIHGSGGNHELIASCFPDEYFLLANERFDSKRRLLKSLDHGLVLVDTDSADSAGWLKKTIDSNPGTVYIAYGKNTKNAAEISDRVYDFLAFPFERWQLKKTLDRAWEKLEQELARKNKDPRPVANMQHSQADQQSITGTWPRVLCDFSRALNAQFKQDKFLGLFLNAVKELVPVGKMAVLARSGEPDRYSILAQQGLEPNIQQRLHFKAREGIVGWLADRGLILRLPETATSGTLEHSVELIQEMKLLSADIAIPLFADGDLKGALCLGAKVTGAPFYEYELELLYSICGNIAVGLNDISLHERLCNQKIYIESILQLMNSGVVAIDNQDRIMTFNQRAGTIINVGQEEIIGRDLRILPSPLGDMLYETRLTGRAYHKEDVKLPLGSIPLELSTYRMTNDAGAVIGSVMIFDDITSRKKAEMERRQVEQLEVLNRFVSQLTHEIKNPMVAIQTFSQLLPDKYDDKAFRDFFSETVKQEVKRLNELVDQLIAFSSQLFYQYKLCTIEEIVKAALQLIHEQGKDREVEIETRFMQDRYGLKADKTCLSRAFSYLINYFIETTGSGKTIHVESSFNDLPNGEPAVKIAITDSGSRVDPEDLEKMFNPLFIQPDSPISLGLPVSKKIIEEHGGLLKVLQNGNGPLRFEISLPVISMEDGEREQPS